MHMRRQGTGHRRMPIKTVFLPFSAEYYDELEPPIPQ